MAAVLKIAGCKPQGFKSSIRRCVNVAELVDSTRLESGRPQGPQVQILPFTPKGRFDSGSIAEGRCDGDLRAVSEMIVLSQMTTLS